ncbi:MAG TPA: hypothetical protein VGR28_13240 [Candidatus Thermoplasmatota archaeon]|jgi:MFS family permease|nr:hypothetical protein [Candidatus Thermoplasmatota archaeon]
MAPPRALLWVAADLSLAAGVAHALVTPEHLQEWWVYGAFFLAATAAQVAFAALVLRWPTRLLLVAGIAGNAFLLLFYAFTRLVGVPLGPAAGELEAVALIDLATKAAELALVIVLAAALARMDDATVHALPSGRRAVLSAR